MPREDLSVPPNSSNPGVQCPVAILASQGEITKPQLEAAIKARAVYSRWSEMWECSPQDRGVPDLAECDESGRAHAKSEFDRLARALSEIGPWAKDATQIILFDREALMPLLASGSPHSTASMSIEFLREGLNSIARNFGIS